MVTFLILYANPKGAEKLKLEEEIRQIRDDVEWVQSSQVKIDNIGFVKKSDLTAKLTRYKPTLVQFSGHGTQNGQLVLEDERGRPSIVPPRALEQLFSNFEQHIKVVLLNSCSSQEQAIAISRHIPCVVGMHGPVADKAARLFSSKFLQSLALGLSVQRSFSIARAELELIDPAVAEVPQLYTKDPLDPDGVIVVPKPRLMARFVKAHRKLSVDDANYDMKLFIEHAPPGISSALYQFCDDETYDFEEQFEESRNRRNQFTVDLTDYADIEIRVVLWGDSPVAFNSLLSEALLNYYEGRKDFKPILPIIEAIRNF